MAVLAAVDFFTAEVWTARGLMTYYVLAFMAALVKQGKTEDDVVAAKPFDDLDKKWAPTELASKNFIRVVYHSLADKTDKKALLKRMLRRG